MSSQPFIKNPFKGLRPFKQEEEEELFGRDRDLILMKDRILSCRTTLLFAGSGVGKTSFLNAKVIPALEKQYCVISHNRWTGAEAKSDDSSLDRPRFQMWPLQAFGRWFLESVIEPFWMRRNISDVPVGGAEKTASGDALPNQTEAPRNKAAAVIQRAISRSLRPGSKRRLSRVLSIFKKRPESKVQQIPCILILDQFEEIFQYHAYEQYFQDFISDLCDVINDDNYQVRVVFSMREEFLGELSVFDNRIPDLFNNYYRLRYPEKDDARYIITQTCNLVNVESVPENLDRLVDDLSTIEKNFDAGGAANERDRSVRLVRRNFVPPPYLQIVCDTLWKQQFDGPDGAVAKPVRFLENYKVRAENAVNGDESDAQKALREFCKAKLSQPFLRTWEQSLAARVFDFLVTKQGAKMAYELRSLASHMGERVWTLKHVLQKLSRPEARILRETRGPEGSYWFELYHDMYAGVVDHWKREYAKQESRHERRRQAGYFALLCVLFLAFFAVITLVVEPDQYRQTIADFKRNLQTTDLTAAKGYPEAISAYYNLENTFGHRTEAWVLWAEVWQKRAQLFELAEQRDEALLCLLQAASLAKDQPAEKDYIAQANNLLTGNEESIRETYCYDCDTERVSPDAKYIMTITYDGKVDIWSSGRKKYLTTMCLECRQAQFSSDSKLVATVRDVREEPDQVAGSASKGNTNEGLSTDRGEVAGGSRTTQAAGAAPSYPRKILGWELKITPLSGETSGASFVIKKPQPLLKPSAPANRGGNSSRDSAQSPGSYFELLAVSNTPQAGYLVAGIFNGRLAIWRQDGTYFAESVPIPNNPKESRSFYALNARFSADGRFFTVDSSGLPPFLWEVSAASLLRLDKIDELNLRGSLLFSPDSKYVLAQAKEGALKLWELGSRQEVLEIKSPDRIAKFGFATGSSKFFVIDGKGAITAWDSEIKKPVFSTIRPEFIKYPSLTFLSLEKDARTLVIGSYGAFEKYGLEKWSLETGQKIGELEIDVGHHRIRGSDGSSVLFSTDSITRLWDIPPTKEREWVNKISEQTVYYAGLSEDGNTVLVFSEKNGTRTARLLDIAQQKELLPPIETSGRNFQLSPDGHRIISEVGNNIDLYDRLKPQPKTSLAFDGAVVRAAFSSDSRFLAVATDHKQVHVIDMTTGARQKFNTAVDVRWLVFTQNSKYLLASHEDSYAVNQFTKPTVNRDTVDMWSVSDGQRVELDVDESEPVQAVAISNERIVLSQNDEILVLNTRDGSRLREFYYGELALLAISPDSKVILICDRRGIMQLRDASSGAYGGDIKLGSPAQKVVFDADDPSFIAITRSWIHRIEISPSMPRLHYDSGIFTGQTEFAPSVRLVPTSIQEGQPPVKDVRWVSQWMRGLEIVDGSFDGKRSKQFLKGESGLLWLDWQMRLGFNVSPSYRLERDTPIRVLSAP